MKAKLSYKSKRNIVISVIVVALLAIAATGTYFFTKGNSDQAQAYSQDGAQTSQSGQEGQTGTQENDEQGTQNPMTGDNQEQSGEQNQNQGQITPELNNNEGSTTNEGTVNPSSTGTTTEGQNTGNENQGGTAGTGTTGTTTGDVPNQEYVTERTETQEVLVSEDYMVEWTPLGIRATTTTTNLSIIRPIISSEKTANKTAVVAGEVITYTITATNRGTADGSAEVKDTIPANTTFEEGSIKVNGEDTAYTAEDLAKGISVNVTKNGGTATLSFTVKVDEGATGTIENKANVNGTDTKEVKNPVITFEKKVLDAEGNVKKTAKVGETLIYTIEITNSGEVAGTAIVKDNVPTETTFEEGSIKVNGKDTAYTAENLANGVAVEVAAGETSKLTFEVTVKDLEDGTKIVNTAKVNDKDTNKTETEYQEAVISQEKTSNKTAVVAGEELTYTITVTNSGLAKGNAEVKDTVPGNTTFKPESIVVTGVEKVKVGDREITVTEEALKELKAEDLEKGITLLDVAEKSGTTNGTATLSFTVKVDEGATGTIANKATVNNNETGEVKNPVITFEKEVNSTEAEVGDNLIYTITATNSGNEKGTIIIKDRAPLGTTFVKDSLRINEQKASYENDEEALNVGISYELAAGETVIVTFQVTVNEDVTGIISNTAYVNGKPTDEKQTKVKSYIIFHENGGSDVADMSDYTGEAISNTTMPTTTRTGYTFKGWYKEEALTNKVETLPEVYPAGTTHYYAKWEANKQKYTVNYLEKGTNRNLSSSVTKEARFGTEIVGKSEKIQIPGYTYDSISTEKLIITDKNEKNVINIYYTANDTKYTVEYYYQEKGVYPKEATEKDETRTEKTDKEVSVTDQDITPTKEGYIFDNNAKNVLEGTVTADGKLVLKVYFKQQFTVTYKPGTQGTFKEQSTDKLEYNADTPEFKGKTTGNDGFYFAGWDKEPADKVTENAVYTALWEGLTVDKTRTGIVDADKLGHTTYVDQEGDIVKYTITVTNIGDTKAKDIVLTDNHKVTVKSVKVEKTNVEISDRDTNTFNAGNNLLQGLSIEIVKGQKIKVEVEYTVTTADLEKALKTENKLIINEATATLNEHEYKGTDKTEGKEGTDVKQRCEYTVEYYFNGKHDTTIKEDVHSYIPEGDTIGFEKPTTLGGYTYLNYYTFNEEKNADTTAQAGENIIKVYYGKAEPSIEKEATDYVYAGNEIEYTITVSNTGYEETTVTVTDELIGTTYVPNSAKVGDEAVEPNTTTNEAGNKVLSWNVKLGAASKENKTVEKVITFKAKTADDSFGDTIYNTAKIDGTDKLDTATTGVKEINVKYNEFKEGQKGTDLNIIFIIDNSSSMNETVADQYFTNGGNKENPRPVAPSDRFKTRLANAKTAINDFIDKQNNKPNTDMAVIAFNTPRTGNTATSKPYPPYTYNHRTLVDNNDIVTEETQEEREVWIPRKKENGKWIPGHYETQTVTVTKKYVTIDDVRYELTDDQKVTATDGNEYYYINKGIDFGSRLIGDNKNSNTNETLKTAVNNITISDDRGGFGTEIVPAYKLINDNKDTYLSDTKKNVIIVLADGAFNDDYDGSELTTLKTNLEETNGEIYCIGFGSDYNESSLEDISTNGKCYPAKDSEDLLIAFDQINEEASGSEQSGTTTSGKITFKEAKNTIKVSTDCPITATYETGEVDDKGNPVIATLFECASKDDLDDYGLEINGRVITWDAKKFVKKNPGKTIPDTVSIKYYIPRS